MSGLDQTEFSNAILAVMGDLAPIFDAADGMRADLERRGWSPTAAESAALTWLTGALAMTFQAAK